MKMTNIEQVTEFLAVVDSCVGTVTLTSQAGDKFNLKSKITQYVAMGALLGKHGDELELWCSNREDEAKFRKFLREHPEI